jgi:hypothetical protein
MCLPPSQTFPKILCIYLNTSQNKKMTLIVFVSGYPSCTLHGLLIALWLSGGFGGGGGGGGGGGNLYDPCMPWRKLGQRRLRAFAFCKIMKKKPRYFREKQRRGV